nr:hypothetical protein [Tanacetum cinerariifolium]
MSLINFKSCLAESYKFLEELQDFELEKCRDLMKSISETQLKVLKKLSLISKLRRHDVLVTVMVIAMKQFALINECLPVILEGAKVFDKKGIHPSDYTISFKLADNVPKQ